MRRYLLLLLVLSMLLLAGCGRKHAYEVEITIPAGQTEGFAYSDEEVSPRRGQLTLEAGAGIAATEVVLKGVEVREENAYEPAELQQGTPVTMEVEKGAWFRIGVSVPNPSAHDIVVSVRVSPVDVRIS